MRVLLGSFAFASLFAIGALGTSFAHAATVTSLNGLTEDLVLTGTNGVTVTVSGNSLVISRGAGTCPLNGLAGGDLSGSYPNPIVASVGGQTAASVASAVQAANAATSANVPGTIVKRDAAGNFSAGAITAVSFSGDGAGLTNVNAVNAAQLGGLPASSYQLRVSGSCPVSQAITSVNADGSVVCAAMPQPVYVKPRPAASEVTP